MRRPILIIIAALAVVVFGVGAYLYFFGGTASVTVAPNAGASLPAAGQSGAGATLPAATNPSVALPSAAAKTVSARLVEIAAGPVVPGVVATDLTSATGSSASTSSPQAAPRASQNASQSAPDIAVGFVLRQSGNLYSYLVRAGTLTRTSNATIPGVESASWLPDGSRVYLRYLSGADFSTVNTYSLAADGSGGFFLPQNLADFSTAAGSIFTLASNANGSSASVARADGSKSAQVFSTPLSAVRASFAGKNAYLVFTKPSAALEGSAYLVNGAGHFSKIAGPLNGLVALASPSGKWVLVSYVGGAGETRLELVSAADGSAVQLPVATIADKCVWAADSSGAYCGIPVSPPSDYAYPDDWYQGAVHFNDRIWKIDVTGRFASLVLDFSTETGGALDATALAVDPNQQALVFVNKNDGSLWEYQL